MLIPLSEVYDNGCSDAGKIPEQMHRPDSSRGSRAEAARELEEHFALVENFIFGQKFEEPLFSIFLTE